MNRDAASIAVMNSCRSSCAMHRLWAMPWLFMLALMAASAQAEAALVIRFAHVVAEDTPKGLAVNRFKELVEQRSGGRIQVEVFPDAQLYGDRDEMEALKAGAVEMLAPSLSKFGRLGFPEFELFDLPYLFANLQEVRRITEGPIGQKLLDRLRRQGMVGLGYFDNGFKQMSANRPLINPADFQGLRMRVQASRVIAAQMRALGATPVTLPFSSTRLALSQGIVQGTENPLSNFWTQRMHTVQTDLSLTQHGYLGYAVITSERFWNSLSTSERQLILQALREALVYGNAIADAQNDKALLSLQEAGTTAVHTLTPAQRELMRAATYPVHKQLGQRIGIDWLRDVERALGH
jgi:C4-dicarboxylate-binding protein DctP